MTRRFSIARGFLWLFVIALGIAIGGGLYETLVVLPLWGATPPNSVIAYHQHTATNPSFALNPGGRFWMFVTPLTALLALAALLSGLKTRAEHRRWRLLGTGLTLFVEVFTFTWFVPNLLLLLSDRVLTMPPDELRSLTTWWMGLNWVRVVLASTAWLAALRALTIPPEAGNPT